MIACTILLSMKLFELGEYIWSHPGYVLIMSLVLAFLIVYISIPSIVTVAHCKRLYDEPGHRKSHHVSVPHLGGVAIFAGLVITTGIFAKITESIEFTPIIASIVVLFFIGVKDDLLIIAPSKKLYGELLSAFIVVVVANLRLTSLHGFLGITEIPYLVSVVLSMFVVIVIVNAYNLIDGIDGLASALGIVSAVAFGVWFRVAGLHNYAILAASLAGSLAAFFIFNVFGKQNKIFMGDTGSLIVGLVISVLAIKFNQANIHLMAPFAIASAPAVSLGFLAVPMFDTIRVFSIRILRKKSPFTPDKNHIHHRLLKLGYSHLAATVILSVYSICMAITVILLHHVGIIFLTLILLCIAIVCSALIEAVIRKNKRKQAIKMEVPSAVRLIAQ